TTSFTYIDQGPDGWAQIHFPQYMKNETAGLVRDASLRELSFVESSVSLFIKNPGAGSSAEASIKINGAEYQYGQKCRDNTINLIAFDKNTSVPYNNLTKPVFNDQRFCGREPQVVMSYLNNQLESTSVSIYHYLNSVGAGDQVVLFSIRNVAYSA